MISTRRFRRIAVFGWLAATWPAYAASLLEAVNAARGFDAGIAAAREARLAGHEKRWQGLAGLLPRAQIDGHYTKQGHFASLFTLEPLEWGKRFAPCENPAAAAPRVPCHADS